MPSYGFSFRASTRKGGGPGKLYLRVIHDGESRSVTTNYRVLPEEWDAVARRLLIPYGRNTRSRELAGVESGMMCDLRRMDVVIRNLEKKGAYHIDELMSRYRAVTADNTLAAFTEKLASDLESAGRYRTAKAYRTAACRLCEFSGKSDLSFENITPELLSDFQHSLKAQACKPNTISFYMRTLRAIYHKAIAEGRVARRAESLFSGVYTGVSPTRKMALTHSELAMLSAFDPTDGRSKGTDRQHCPHLPGGLGRALAMFLFCYYARGMCFVDMVNLKKKDLRGGTIRYRRQKTGQAIEVRVLPEMRRIIDWFAPQTADSRYLFPVLKDGTRNLNLQYESGLRLQNKRLKRIAALCGISKKLSTHAARHSWATVAKSAGLPLAVISEGLGHTNQRTTEIYLASLERSVIDHASRVVAEAITQGKQTKKRNRPTSSGGLPGYHHTFGYMGF